jgi:hypothetical protein
MSRLEPLHEVLDCLSNEMNINIEHFLTKYHSFDNSFKQQANRLLLNMLLDSKEIAKLYGDVHYYEKGDFEQNNFMQAMFDCFKELNTKKGLELHKAIYEHTNRGGENWFPIVEICSPVEDYSHQPNVITVFRGCSLEEFENNNFRQSWSSRREVAQAFAFSHFNIDNKNRAVIRITVKNSDIAWVRNEESEIVLLPNFTPLSSIIELDYKQYCQLKK